MYVSIYYSNMLLCMIVHLSSGNLHLVQIAKIWRYCIKGRMWRSLAHFETIMPGDGTLSHSDVRGIVTKRNSSIFPI